MTAHELYEIVKDVPREAWPEYLSWHPCITGGYFKADCDETGSMLDTHAKLAFIGSMMKWLLDRDAVIQRLVDGRHGIRIPVWKAGRDSELIGANWHLSPTLIEALAAACKVVGVKPG